MDSSKIIPWLDIETTGLDQETNYITELGIKLTDHELNVLAERRWILGIGSPSTDHGHDRALRINEVSGAAVRGQSDEDYFVSNMHHESGLWLEVSTAVHSERDVEIEAMAWCTEWGVSAGTLPLAGSTISFDRKFLERWMPTLNEFFHYRVIDVSTIKNLASMYRPDVYDQARTMLDAFPKAHRTLADLNQSIAELKLYMESGFINIEG